MTILVVGAGFSGAVYARELAEAGYQVRVIDQRAHIGGNAWDYVDAAGVRVHAYGPHLFHSKSRRVIDWITRFGRFVPFEHRVRAKLPDGRLAPLPINLETINLVFGTRFERAEEVRGHLARVAERIAVPANAAEYLYGQIGRELTDLFFRPYTRKMWAMDLEEMAAAVVKRIPLRFDLRDTYFADDETQILPEQGYEALFAAIFDHRLISVELNTAFERADLARVAFCFNAMPIDVCFGHALGELPYRSLRFHHRREQVAAMPTWSVTNFTDAGPMTRETRWDALPGHRVHSTGYQTVTREEPCDYRDNGMERYYPVKTADGRYGALYERYRALAEREQKMRFIGRCGTYQYLDMDQVINQSLCGVREWLGFGQAFDRAS